MTQVVCVAAEHPARAARAAARARARPGRDAASIRGDIADGMRWLWRHAAVRTLTITIVIFNVTFGAAWSVLVLYSLERLDLGDVGFGLLTSALACGGLLATVSLRLAGAARQPRQHHARRADHRDADPPRPGPDHDPGGRAGDHVRLRRPCLRLGDHVVRRAPARRADRRPGPCPERLHDRRDRRHRRRLARSAGRSPGLGRHGAVLVRLRRLGADPGR